MNTFRASKWLIRLIFIGVTLTACSTSAAPPTPNGIEITLKTNPETPQIGDGQLIVDVLDANKQPLDGADVEISMGMSSMSMGTQNGPANFQGKGRYVRPVTFHQKGDYTVRIWVNRSGQTLKTQDFPFTLK